MFVNAYETTAADTPETMLANAGLDWRVQRTTPAIRPIGYKPGESDPASFQVQDGYRFLRRSDTGEVFGCVSSKYRPHQNIDIIGTLNDSARALGTRITRLGSLRGGSWVFAQVDLGKEFTLGRGDRVRGLLTITTKHDGTGATRGGGSSVCIVCQNTFMMASRDLRAVISHRQDVDSDNGQQVLAEALEEAATDFGVYSKTAARLSSTPVKSKDALLDWLVRLTDPKTAAERDAVIAGRREVMEGAAVLDSIMAAQEERASSMRLTEDILNRQGKGILEAIMEGVGQDDPARKGTWWGAVNGVTYYTNWTARARNADLRAASAMAGPNADLNRRALELAMEASMGQPADFVA